MRPNIDLTGFARELDGLAGAARTQLGDPDLRHLRRFERWSNACALLGLATAALGPTLAAMFAPMFSLAWLQPLALVAGAVLISLGRSSRWILMHHISHGGYDRVPGVPKRYTSKVFAHGWRRLLDWPDWIEPAAWRYEHNVLHHAYTGEANDPDLVERNSAFIRRPRWMVVRYLILIVAIATWRFTYYAPTAAWALRRGHPNKPRSVPRRFLLAVLVRSHLFYVLVHFVAMPALFLPLGTAIAINVLIATLIGELLCNIHTCAVIAPNHTGDDLYRFNSPAGSRKVYYFRQVIGSVNMRCGGDFNDFLHLWLNYQVEHHLWPDLPMLRYRQLQPQVREICQRYGVPYVQQSVWARIWKTADVAVGRTSMQTLAGDVPATVTL